MNRLNEILAPITDECFPLKTYQIRASDPPWMTHSLRDMIEKRKAIFATDNKRSERWKRMKALTDKLILEKRGIVESLKLKMKESGNVSHFYKAVKAFKDHEKPPEWDVRSLFLGKVTAR